nr:MAG TPA: hypothetical protein [Caudoviricetes sp.]
MCKREVSQLLHWCIFILFVPSKHVKKLIKWLLK